MIPDFTMMLVKEFCKVSGIDTPEVQVIKFKDRCGKVFGIAQGFICSTTLEQKEEYDSLFKFLEKSGFEIVNCYEGESSDTECYEIAYKSSFISNGFYRF